MSALESTELTDAGYDALRDAVNLARAYQIGTVDRLKKLLIDHGHAATDVDSAVKFWANYEAKKRRLDMGD